MAAKHQGIIGSHFQDLVDNLEITVIAPLMRTAGILSAESEIELHNKATRKQQIRFIINQVKLKHPSGDDLFKDCLERSKHLEGHQKLLSLLYRDSCAGM